MSENVLYYGDNLDVLRSEVRDKTVDLVYLDPPFNSNQNYNVLFAERDGTRAAAQIKAFGDTWRWDRGSAFAYQQIVETGPEKVAQAMRAFRTFLGDTDMMAYLAMMAPRLVELRRVLKDDGSLILHCDPTASHYLKMLLDGIFGPQYFRNEVVWRRSGSTGSSKSRARQFPRSHDVLLFYTKGDTWTWNPPVALYSEAYRKRFKWDDGDGRGPYRKNVLATYSADTFARLERENRLVAPVKPGAQWSYKQYVSESRGSSPLDDVWADINPLNAVARERLGYPTQKPEALLERVIRATTDAGATVLDPFCGCGTTVAAAQKLDRKWIGIDITSLAINLIQNRLWTGFGSIVRFVTKGFPETLQDARKLAQDDRYQFQWWALTLVNARGTEQKKGADRGIDGRLLFHDEPGGGKTKEIIFSVKSGHVSVKDVRELSDVVRRERAQIGVLITLEHATRPMRSEAADAGFYVSGWGDHPRIQILTVEELMNGARVDYPAPTGANVTLKPAPRQKPRKAAEPLELPLVTDRDAILAERAAAQEARKELARGVPSAYRRAGKGTGRGHGAATPPRKK